MLWHSRPLGAHVRSLAIFGFLGNVVSNSIGGDAAGDPSGSENIVRVFGVETRLTFYLPTWFNIALVVVGLVILAAAFLVRDHRRGSIGP